MAIPLTPGFQFTARSHRLGRGWRLFWYCRALLAMRQMQAQGFGAWFGAFLAGRMVSGLGVVGDGSGVVRFQNVDTHPEYRNQGLAGTLVHKASQFAQ